MIDDDEWWWMELSSKVISHVADLQARPLGNPIIELNGSTLNGPRGWWSDPWDQHGSTIEVFIYHSSSKNLGVIPIYRLFFLLKNNPRNCREKWKMIQLCWIMLTQIHLTTFAWFPFMYSAYQCLIISMPMSILIPAFYDCAMLFH